MISGIDLSQIVSYTCKGDTENPTIWQLGVIPGKVMTNLAMESTKQEQQADFMYKTLRFGLKGWVNFNKPYKTSREKVYGDEYDLVDMDILNTIPVNIIAELAGEIFKINSLQDKEAKN